MAETETPQPLRLACGQLGGIQPDEPRASAVARMVALMHRAKAADAQLIAFPELALTTFFPRYVIDDPAALDAWFDAQMPGPETQPLFDAAAALGIGFYLGYAERTGDGHHYNSAILVDDSGQICGRYRKIHLPGEADPVPGRRYQHLEKRYFEIGDLGFPVFSAFGTRIGMALCNDRRWPETYRMLALQGAEVVLIGYNTPVEPDLYPAERSLSAFQNHLSLQAGAHLNAIWVAGIAKCGHEGECELLGGTAIIGPSGEIVAQTATDGDELIVATCHPAAARPYREDLFDFDRHRQIEHYGLITAQRGVVVATS